MKVVVVFLFAVCYVQCRKIVPIDKNANVAFINMEGGGGTKPVAKPGPPASQPLPVVPGPAKPASPPASPQQATPPKPLAPVTSKPVQPVQPSLPQPKQPTQIQPKPVNPAPVANPITTPGPGSVKQLVNFYDSQGKASPIRPYTYSQAVKQG